MDHTTTHPSIDELKQFTPLQALTNQQLALLAGAADIKTVGPNTVLMELGSDDDTTYFLLEGTLLLNSKDHHTREIKDSDRTAKSPIAQLRPRQYRVESLSQVRYLVIDNAYLEDITQHHPPVCGIEGYQVTGDRQYDPGHFQDQLLAQLIADLEADCLVLPSLPDVAIHISQALEDGISNTHQIAKLIQVDPVITAKLIKAANRAVYGQNNPVTTCSGAIVRLGGDVTHKLVLSYALRELFQSDSDILNRRMEALWKHSTQVAAICYVLAKQDSRFQPEHAMLAGLVHDIGTVAILSYAQHFPNEAMQPELIDLAIQNMRAQIGGLILDSWRFPEEFVVAAREAEEWMRNKGSTPDYCDLVIIAQLHSYIGSNQDRDLPAIDEVPAHSRLELGELTPHMSLKILERAKDLLGHAHCLLNL